MNLLLSAVLLAGTGGLVALLIHILIIALILGLIWWVLTLIPLPDPFALILRVVFAIICVIIVINLLLGFL
jgi:hypothetical protein